MAKRQPPKIFYILTPALSSLLTILFIELVLRVFYPVPYSIEYNMYFIPDPYTGFRLKPNSIGYYQANIPAVANSRGHRDDEVDLEKKKGVFRILVLGDSFTVGANVPQEYAYPQELERLLNEHLKKPVEVINSAVGAWEPFQYAQYYEYYGQAFDPDLVLIGFFVGNDTYAKETSVQQTLTAIEGRRVSREKAGSSSIGIKIWLYENFHLMRLVLNKGPEARNFIRENCQDFTKQYLGIQRQRLPNHLRRNLAPLDLAKQNVYQILRIKKLAAPKQIPVIVVLIPDENQINNDLQQKILKEDESTKYDFDMPQSILIEMFRYIGVSKIIDLLPEFRNSDQCLYMNDTHWTVEGHQLGAKIIFEQIKSYIP